MSEHRLFSKVRPAAVATLVVAAASAFGGCAEPREAPAGADGIEVTWVDDVAPLLAERCGQCHAGETAAADYALDAYCDPAMPSFETCRGALGPGADELPNVIAGDATSRLLTKLEEDPAHFAYLADDEGARADRLELLRGWVVDDGAAYFVSSIHSPEVLNPRREEFHGRTIAQDGWDMESCRSCHGDDYRGGAVDVSCVGCHTGTPESCDTCHGQGELGAPPPGLEMGSAGVGAHVAHLVGSGAFGEVACTECHVVPADFDPEGHIGPDPDGRAELVFGELAGFGEVEPSYDPSTGACTVYCHGAAVPGGSETTPEWNQGPTAAACGTCHGVPPEELSNGQPHALGGACGDCHPVEAGTGAPEPALHVDGAVGLLDRVTAADCAGCHTGTAPFVAPFRDLQGDTDPADPQVGAHAIHLVEAFFSAGTGCASCHVVPATVGEHGHVDPDAGVEVAFSGVASANGLNPTWDAATGTCSNTWCHGAALDGGATESPAWSDADAATVCGDCHGLPPDTLRNGNPHPAATTCGGCHGGVIDDAFSWVDKSKHINGTVDTGN